MGELPKTERRDQNDWVLLELEVGILNNKAAVEFWGVLGPNSTLTMAGFPDGAGNEKGGSGHYWETGDRIEVYVAEAFRQRRTAADGLIVLDGPNETRPGMSGAGVFDQEQNLIGIHRSSHDASLKRTLISAEHIRQFLLQKGLIPADHKFQNTKVVKTPIVTWQQLPLPDYEREVLFRILTSRCPTLGDLEALLSRTTTAKVEDFTDSVSGPVALPVDKVIAAGESGQIDLESILEEVIHGMTKDADPLLEDAMKLWIFMQDARSPFHPSDFCYLSLKQACLESN